MHTYIHRTTRIYLASCLVTTFLTTIGPTSRAVGATGTIDGNTTAGKAHPASAGRHAPTAASRTKTVAKGQSTAARSGPEIIHVGGDRHARDGGGGMMRIETEPRTVQSIGKQFIDMKSPQSDALDLIKTLPSVSVSTPDTSGMQGGSIISRGLTDADMALMIDGGPQASAAYMAESLDSENLESVNLTPGSSSIDLPVTSAAAGVMDERTHTPSHKFGGMMDFSYGTNNLSREFIRLESGDIGKTGIRTYFSFSNSHARSWMGGGINSKRHIDFGAQKDWENGSYAKFFISWDYHDFTIDTYGTAEQFHDFKRTGQSYDPNQTPSSNNYWANNIDHWQQVYLIAPVHIVLPAKFKLDVTPYFNWGQGWSSWGDGASGPYWMDTATTSNGQAIGDNRNLSGYFQQDYAMRVGVTAKLGYDIDRHNHLYLGYWYQNQDYMYHEPISLQQANGHAPSPNNASYQLFTDGQRYNPGNDSGIEEHSIFIGDSAKYLHDRLTVDAGFKYVMANYWYRNFDDHNVLNQQLGQNTTTPLPHLSIGYTFNSHHQIYVNAESDFRLPDPSALAASGLNNGAIPKSQYAIKEELGYRYHDRYVIIDISAFNYNITNRLMSYYIEAGVSGMVNVGNQTSRGFDAMISTRPFHGFSPYASVEYLNSRLDSNVRAQGMGGEFSYLPTAGKQAPMAPHVMANFGLTYASHGFFANATVHYTGPQSVTLAGDERIPGYVTDTLSLGYHFKPFMYAKTPTFRLNFTNLTGSIVRTGANGVGTNATAARLMNGDTIAQDPSSGQALFYVEPRFSMTGTISTSF